MFTGSDEPTQVPKRRIFCTMHPKKQGKEGGRAQLGINLPRNPFPGCFLDADFIRLSSMRSIFFDE
jgi:hypothetical protein